MNEERKKNNLPDPSNAATDKTANDKPNIEIPDPLGDATNLLQKEVAEMKLAFVEELSGVKKIFSWTMTFIIGVLGIGFLTLLFALAGLIMNAYQMNVTHETAPANTISTLEKQKLESINGKILELENKLSTMEKEQLPAPPEAAK